MSVVSSRVTHADVSDSSVHYAILVHLQAGHHAAHNVDHHVGHHVGHLVGHLVNHHVGHLVDLYAT